MSDEDKTSVGSKPTSAAHRHPCPFALDPLPHFNPAEPNEAAKFIEGLAETAEPGQINQEAPETLTQLRSHLESLDQAASEQSRLLKERVAGLRTLLKEQFGVTDVEAWLAQQQEAAKAKEAKVTLTIPADAIAKPATTLRIKLVDDRKPAAPGGVGRGAGAKNLSRMNKPAEASTDSAKSKAISQIPIHVFWNHVETFFKPIDDVDMKFLGDATRIIDPGPFIIPPLGKPYLEQWQGQYGYVKSSGGKQQLQHQPVSARPLDHAGELHRPGLRDRLLALLVDEGLEAKVESEEESIPADMAMDSDIDVGGPPTPPPSIPPKPADYVKIDERIKKDLVGMGFDEFSGALIDYQEDDGICVEMRSLQRQLQEQIAINYYRKGKLAELIRTKLPAQEFYSLLSDLDKQLEQIYTKRTKTSKKKKKGGSSGPSETPTVTTVTTPSEAIKLLETRSKLLTSFQPYIPKLSDFLNAKPSHLLNPSEEAEVLRVCRDTGHWLSIPGDPVPTDFSRPLPSAQPIFPPK